MHTARTAFVATLAAAFATVATGQSVFTSTNTAFEWGDAANWTPAAIPGGIDAAVTFNAPSGGNQNVTSFGAARTVGSLAFDNSSANSIILSGSEGLVFDVSAGSASLSASGTTTTAAAISSGITLNDNLIVTVGNTSATDNRGALALSGVISGAGRITKEGAGTLSLAGSTSTYTGGVTINAGTVRITGGGLGANPASYAAAHITLNGGRLQFDGTTGFSSASNRGFTIGASGGEIAVTNTGNYTISAIVTGAGVLTKTGAGTLVLTGINSFTGGIVINEGVVSVGTMSALGSTASLNTSAVVLDGGTLRFTAATVRAGSNRAYRVGADTGTIEVADAVEARLQGAFRNLGTDAGILRKTGLGTLSLENNTNSHTGGTLLEAGTLRLNGGTLGGAGGAGLSVSSGATFDGRGTINGATTFADGSSLRLSTYDTTATVVPNPITSPVATFTFNNNLTLGDVTLSFDLDTTAASDRIDLASGAVLDIGSGVFDLDNFIFTPLGEFGVGTYTLISTSTTVVGTTGSNTFGTIGGYNVSLALGNGGQTLDLIVTAVPEPSAFAALAGLGMLGYAASRRRRAR